MATKPKIIGNKRKWPIITKDNFEKFIKKNTKCYKWDKYVLTCQLPTNDKEFAECTKALYGITLHVNCLAYPFGSFSREYSCKYKIEEYEREYSKNPIYKLWEKKFGEYDGLQVLLDSVFGGLSCGGVAGHHYGQTKCSKEQWEIVNQWGGKNEEKVIESYKEQNKDLCEIFGFNPFI